MKIKNSIAIGLIIIFTLPVFSKLVYLTYFHLNRDYIELNFCENKNKPELNCHGNCHLQKNLSFDIKTERHSLPLPNLKDQSEIFGQTNEFNLNIPSENFSEKLEFHFQDFVMKFILELNDPPPETKLA